MAELLTGEEWFGYVVLIDTRNIHHLQRVQLLVHLPMNVVQLIIVFCLFQWKSRWGVVTKLSPAAGEYFIIIYQYRTITYLEVNLPAKDAFKPKMCELAVRKEKLLCIWDHSILLARFSTALVEKDWQS